MIYCNECGSLIIPKKEKTTGKIQITCKKCGAQYPSDSLNIEDYILSFDVNDTLHDKIDIVKEKGHREKLITSEDREAYEDFFHEGSEEDSGSESA
ncbi:MAG: hypothetical protein LUQ65_13020 [Candidatus Helarchaeota archaeon]|nr:hypothetical protein [Candidatus Helarchaeota archaeon]